MIKGVIFDMDGVLVDNRDAHIEAFTRLFKKYGVPFDREKFMPSFGMTNDMIFARQEPELLERVEDVILCRRPDAAERLTEYAQQVRTVAQTQPQAPDAWRAGTLGERIGHAMLKGVADFIEQDALEGYETLGSPMAVIDTLLMPAMEHVGTLFGEGKMFLP